MTNSPLAHIDPEAKIGKNVTIHAFSYIDKNVEIGDNCVIMPYASILSGTRMGSGNKVHQGAILGATPQDFKFKGDDTILEIGNNNIIREQVIINRATFPDGKTIIGNGNFLLQSVNIMHDAHIGNDCIIGNGSRVGGNCIIDDKAILGSSVILKQGCRVGSWTLLRDGCRANKNVPPYIIAAHNPISFFSINSILLSKCGNVTEEIIDDIARAYRLIYQSGVSLENALQEIKEQVKIGSEIKYLLDFIGDSTNGIMGITVL